MVGRTKARPYYVYNQVYTQISRSERASTACRRYAVDGSVGDAPVVVNPALSVGDA